jgi:ribosomal protein S16
MVAGPRATSPAARRASADFGPKPGVWHNGWLSPACPDPLIRPRATPRSALDLPHQARDAHSSTFTQGDTTLVAVKIRLKRMGKIRTPYYRVVVVDSRKKRDGKVIEQIGKYHPKEEPSLIEVTSDRAQYWLGVGAQPS